MHRVRKRGSSATSSSAAHRFVGHCTFIQTNVRLITGRRIFALQAFDSPEMGSLLPCRLGPQHKDWALFTHLHVASTGLELHRIEKGVSALLPAPANQDNRQVGTALHCCSDKARRRNDRLCESQAAATESRRRPHHRQDSLEFLLVADVATSATRAMQVASMAATINKGKGVYRYLRSD